MSRTNRPVRRSITLQGASFSVGLIGTVIGYLLAVPHLTPFQVFTLGLALILVDVLFFIWATEPVWRWVWRNFLDPNRL